MEEEAARPSHSHKSRQPQDSSHRKTRAAAAMGLPHGLSSVVIAVSPFTKKKELEGTRRTNMEHRKLPSHKSAENARHQLISETAQQLVSQLQPSIPAVKGALGLPSQPTTPLRRPAGTVLPERR